LIATPAVTNAEKAPGIAPRIDVLVVVADDAFPGEPRRLSVDISRRDEGR
jgi:hypothetical protein